MKNKQLSFIILAIFIFTYFISILPLVKNSRLLRYDDTVIVEPLYKVNNYSDYKKLKEDFLIWDFQPIRDFSYIIDIKLNKFTKFWNFHYSNFLIWFLIGIGIYLFLIKFVKVYSLNFKNEYLNFWAAFFAILYLTHPVMQLGPFWISSRKHLLSELFIIYFCYLGLCYLTSKSSFKYIILLPLLYILSSLSQPISIAFPLLLFLFIITVKDFKFLFSKTNIFLFVVLFLTSLYVAYENLNFYNIQYPKMTRGLGYQFNVSNIWQVRLLTIGRFFYQIFDVSMASPVGHDLGSIRNILGLISLPPFVYICYKKINPKVTFVLFSLFLIPTSVVIFGNVKIFALDTYLLIGSIGIFSLIFILLIKFKYHYFFGIILIFNMYFTNLYSIAFRNELSLFKFAYDKEITSYAQVAYARELVNNGLFDQALIEVYALVLQESDYPELSYLYPVCIYGSKKLSVHQKIKLLSKAVHNNFFFNYYNSILNQKNSSKFFLYQKQAIENISLTFPHFDQNKGVIRALAFYKVYGHKDLTESVNNTVAYLKKNSPTGFWSDSVYFDSLFELYKRNSSSCLIEGNSFNIDFIFDRIQNKNMSLK